MNHQSRAPLDAAGTRAPAAVTRYLGAAKAAIDDAFGDGHAAANPELVAAFLQACAIETAVDAGRIASRETNETLLKLKPRLFG